jgi:hypothetical protein
VAFMAFSAREIRDVIVRMMLPIIPWRQAAFPDRLFSIRSTGISGGGTLGGCQTRYD